MIYENCEYDLEQHLLKQFSSLKQKDKNFLSEKMIYKILQDIISALFVLSENSIIHGNINLKNIFVCDDELDKKHQKVIYKLMYTHYHKSSL